MDNNTLTLNVINKPDHSDFDQTSLKVTRKGATFGRKSENTHTLPDREKIISSYHAAISLVDGKFTLTDTSTNGTIVNEAPITFPKALAQGDVITIGKYQFSVDLNDGEQKSAQGTTPLPQNGPAVESGSGVKGNDATPQNSGSFLDDLAAPASEAKGAESLNQASDNQSALLDTQNDPFAEFLAPKPLSPKTQEKTYHGSNDGLDEWLEPSQQKNEESLFSAPPNGMAVGDQSLIGNEITDPLVALNQASEPEKNTISKLIGEANPLDETSGDDQWWLESGSHGDHASPLNQAIETNQTAKTNQTTAGQANIPEQTPPAQQSQPWELDNIEPHSIDDFLAESAPPQTQTPGTQTPIMAHNQLNDTDSALDQWLSQSNNTQADTPFNEALAEQNTQDSIFGQRQESASPHNSTDQYNSAEPYNSTGQRGETPQASDQAINHAPASQSYGNLTHALAAELGLNRLTDQEKNNLIPEVSAILKETTSRLLEVLIARSNVKNEMRLERTMIKTSENNPLKFSVSGDDALQNLLAPRSSAFLSGKDAIGEAFDDLADHQIALLSGMREAYNQMLNHFSPDSYIDTSQSSANKGIFKGSGKAKQWDAFTAEYESLKKDQEAAYNQLFGDHFNRVYEEKITSLKVLRQKHKPM